MNSELNRTKLRHIELYGSDSLICGASLSLSLPDSHLSVVIGENGSGKSLVVASILASFHPGESGELLDGLRDGGLREIKLTLERGGEWIEVRTDVVNGTRSIHTVSGASVDDSNNGSSRQFVNKDDLFTNCALVKSLHCILNGYVSEPHEEMMTQIGTVLRRPIEEELASWKARLEVLVGSDGDSGQMREAQLQHDNARADLQRVQELQAEAERLRLRQVELHTRMQELTSSGAILKAERDETERIVGLAERAVRVESWLTEVHRDIARVESLRDTHEQTQAELDQLAARFRGAPDHFADLLDEYEQSVNSRDRCRASWDQRESTWASLQEEITELEQELNSLRPPLTEGMQKRIDELQIEISTDEAALVSMLRDRIELLRNREGLDQKLKSEFSAFGSLDNPALESLRQYCNRPETDIEANAAAEANQKGRKRLQDRHDEIAIRLQTEFAGYESLSDQAVDEINDLHKIRILISETSDVLESLLARKTDVEAAAHSPRWIAACIAAALVAGVPFGLLAGWDIGVFAALVGSGLIWMAYRHTQRTVEHRLLELTEHETTIRKRWKSSIEAKLMLERLLGPLAGLNKDEANDRLKAFRSLVNERDEILASLSKLDQRMEATPPVVVIPLPKGLTGMSRDLISEKLRQFEELRAEKKRLDQQWNFFESGGDTATRIEGFESRISKNKREVEQLQTALTEETRKHASQLQMLSGRLSELREQLPNTDEAAILSHELSEIETRLSGLVEQSGQILLNADPIELRHQWQRLADLRIRQRTLKNDLSACLSLEEMRSRQSILTDELHEVTFRLCELDPLYLVQGNARDYARKYHGQLEFASLQVADQLTQLGEMRHELETLRLTEIQNALTAEPSLETLEAALEGRTSAVDDLRREIQTTRELAHTLERDLDAVEPHLPAQLESAINRLLHRYFGEDFGSIHFIEGEWYLRSVLNQDRRIRSLSRGQADLVRLVIHAGVFEILSAIDDDFVLWDDVLGNLDEQRLSGLQGLIREISRSRQIVLFSRDHRFADWGDSIQIEPASRVEAAH